MASERVLIVDDEPQILRALQTALSGHGYQVDIADDGETALTQVASRPPDAIVITLKDGPFRHLHGEWRFIALGDIGCRIEFELAYEVIPAIDIKDVSDINVTRKFYDVPESEIG